MSIKKYQIDKEGKECLEIARDFHGKGTRISFHGKEIAYLESTAELKEGKHFRLDESRLVMIKRVGFFFPEYDIFVNGKAVVDKNALARYYVFNAAQFVIITGLISFCVGAFMTCFRQKLNADLEDGLVFCFTSLLYIGLGAWMKQLAKTPLIILVVLMIFEFVCLIYFSLGSNVNLPWLGIALKVVLFYLLVRAFAALKALERISAE